MDGENNGKPYEQMDDLGIFIYFWFNTHIPLPKKEKHITKNFGDHFNWKRSSSFCMFFPGIFDKTWIRSLIDLCVPTWFRHKKQPKGLVENCVKEIWQFYGYVMAILGLFYGYFVVMLCLFYGYFMAMVCLWLW